MIFLGVDGGQTHSMAVLINELGNILGVGHGNPCSRFDFSNGETGYCQAIQEVTDRVFLNARLSNDTSIAGACFGLTDPWERAASTVRQCLNVEQLCIVEDVQAAHVGALAGEPGIVVLAGTGTAAYGRNPTGKSVRVGGWGHYLSDEGSGYDIGQHVLHACAKAFDGRGPDTILLGMVLEHFKLDDLSSLSQALLSGSINRIQIALLSGLAARAAQKHDPVSLEIFRYAGQELARSAQAVAAQLNWSDPPVSGSGGIFNAGEIVITPFRQFLENELPEAKVLPSRYPPVIGAALMALMGANQPLTPQILHNLDDQLNLLSETLETGKTIEDCQD